MKKNSALKKILALALCALTGASFLTGCSVKGKTLDEVKQAGKLVIGTSPDFPPFENLEGGSITGIEVDLMQLICSKLGVTMELKDMSFETVLAAVPAGKIDVGMSGISVTEKRQKNMLFTDPYCLAAQAIVVPEGSAIASKADLSGKKIAVQTATTAEEYCLANGYSVSSFEANADAETALLQGKVDAWVIDDLTAAAMVADYNASSDTKLVILGEAMTTEPYAFAFAFGSETLVEEINKIIAEMLADGTIAGLFEKYDAPFTSPVK